MQLEKFGRSLLGAFAVTALAACSPSSASSDAKAAAPAVKAVPVTAAPTTTTGAPTTTSTTRKPTTTTTAPKPRAVMNTNFGPFLQSEGIVLNYPTRFVERVGFHESNKAGSRFLGVLPSAGDVFDLPSRERRTNARTAADVLSEPRGEVRAPVTGRVLRAGTYTLYCKYTDSYLVIEPDAHPGFEVKLLHITNLVVGVGQRVDAGVTTVAAYPTRLPFKSQVEDWSTAPVWPHVHLEVDDPTIKNPPGVGGKGCS